MAGPVPREQRSADLPILGPADIPCPQCRSESRGIQRLGNRRRACATCNWFYQQVQRRIARKLKDKYADEVRKLRVTVERDVFALAIERYNEQNPGNTGFFVEVDERGVVVNDDERGRR